MTDAERIDSLAKQVCDYEDTLFRIAYPQKRCVGRCRCYDPSFPRELAEAAFHAYNPKPSKPDGVHDDKG